VSVNLQNLFYPSFEPTEPNSLKSIYTMGNSLSIDLFTKYILCRLWWYSR